MTDNYWENRYRNESTGWDIGYPSTPLKMYIDQLESKHLRILIPGAGNAYEAEYLHNKGCSNVSVLDIAPTPLKGLRDRRPDFPEERLLREDFFEHQGEYDLILEQTFFCSFPPEKRPEYVKKTHELLAEGGTLAGLFFNFPLTENGPPFGGDKEEYITYFKGLFHIKILESCYNSIKPRQGNELFFIFEKK